MCQELFCGSRASILPKHSKTVPDTFYLPVNLFPLCPLWFIRLYKCLSNHKEHEGHKEEKGRKALSTSKKFDQCFLVGVMALEAEPFVNADRWRIFGMDIQGDCLDVASEKLDECFHHG
jgi:hypothetical protein